MCVHSPPLPSSPSSRTRKGPYRHRDYNGGVSNLGPSSDKGERRHDKGVRGTRWRRSTTVECPDRGLEGPGRREWRRDGGSQKGLLEVPTKKSETPLKDVGERSRFKCDFDTNGTQLRTVGGLSRYSRPRWEGGILHQRCGGRCPGTPGGYQVDLVTPLSRTSSGARAGPGSYTPVTVTLTIPGSTCLSLTRGPRLLFRVVLSRPPHVVPTRPRVQVVLVRQLERC